MSERVTIYLPVGHLIGQLHGITAGSAIVGRQGRYAGQLHIYYADARHLDTAIYADRVALAAGRLLENYPTVARREVDYRTLRPIGEYDPREGEVLLLEREDHARLATYLRLDRAELDGQLHATGARFEQRRTLRRAIADRSMDPATVRRLAAQWGHEDLLDEAPRRDDPKG
jgi:hypothetical protein